MSEPEYEIIDENYKSEPHEPDQCGKCTFVANPDCIVITKDLEARVNKASGSDSVLQALSLGLGIKKIDSTLVRLGHYTMTNWTGCLPFYAFLCQSCKNIGVSYLHGYNLYVLCNHCKFSFNLTDKIFFKEAGLDAPASFSERVKYLLKLRRQL